ncbi:hypothetical protein Y695_04533 [Hydrogenophaga sp. T4]|nr:hypothetical protein Y695_04533 [Hydrogenophaga sp. T4]
MPRRRLSSRRACMAPISVRPASENSRPLRIFLSSMSSSTRSTVSPICSMLMVKLMMSVQRRLSVSLNCWRESLVR